MFFFFFRNTKGCDEEAVQKAEGKAKREREGNENGRTSSRFKARDAMDARGVTEQLAQGSFGECLGGGREGVLRLSPAFAEAGSPPLGVLVRTVSHR